MMGFTQSKPRPKSQKNFVVSNECNINNVKVTQSCLTLCDPMDYTVQGILQDRILEWQPFLSSGDLSNQESNPGLLHQQVDSLPSEPPGKPKKTGVGSLSLLQRIFLTQESNRGLLHCRQILDQLSYQGNSIQRMPNNKCHFPSGRRTFILKLYILVVYMSDFFFSNLESIITYC